VLATPQHSQRVDASGNFSLTNTISPDSPRIFYKLQLQYFSL